MRISDWSSDVCSSDLLEQALALNEGERAAGSSETDRPESPVIDLCYLSWTSFALGEPEQALAQCRRSLDVAAARGASYDLVVANGNACYLHQLRHDRDAVPRCAPAVIDLASDIGFPPLPSLGRNRNTTRLNPSPQQPTHKP